MDFDSIIIGGGTVGLLSAVVLAADGFRVAVIDRSPGNMARPGGAAGNTRTLALSDATIRLLRRVEIWEAVAPHACPIDAIRVTDRTPSAPGPKPRRDATLDFERNNVAQGTLGAVVENHCLTGCLQQKVSEAAEITLIPGAVAELPPPRSDGSSGHQGYRAPPGAREVCVTTQAGTKTYTAPLVIAADGGASPSRMAANIKYVRRAYRQSAVTALLGHPAPHDNKAWQDFLPQGPCALLPLVDSAGCDAPPPRPTPSSRAHAGSREDGGHRSALVWTLHAKTATTVMQMTDTAFCAILSRHTSQDLGGFALLSPRQAVPLGFLLASRFYADRLALVGDAAHTIHPLAGQGFNLAVKDIAALRDVLVTARYAGGDIGHGRILAQYDRWRRGDVLGMSFLTHGLNTLFGINAATAPPALAAPVAAIRRAGMAVVNRHGMLKARAQREAAGRGGEMPSLLQ